MTRAFIVHLELEEDQVLYLAGLAEDMRESLETDGFKVISVAPFSNPEASTENAAGGLPTLPELGESLF